MNIDRKKLYFLIEQSNSTGREESEIKKQTIKFLVELSSRNS